MIELTDELIDSLKIEEPLLAKKQEVKLDPFREAIVKLSIQMTNFVNMCVTYEMNPDIPNQRKLKIRKIFEATMAFLLKWTNPNMNKAVAKHMVIENMRIKIQKELMES